MLELRPSCEHCDKDLPPESEEACICTYECTFCRDCVNNVLENVCPNCGGGFTPRPIRPKTEWRPGLSTAHQAPTINRKLRPVDLKEQSEFVRAIKEIPPSER